MEWLTTNTEYDGLPLYLRMPNYKNIWQYQLGYPTLMCITHEFDSAKDNGLPTSEYNKSLMDFDGDVVSLFDQDKNGIVFLVETFGGVRNYWFYTKDREVTTETFEKLKGKNLGKKLELDIKNDPEWKLIVEYPIELYKK